MSDLQKSLENLKKAQSQLAEFLTIATPSKVERAGIIQAFEFCYEVFWKTFQKRATEEGLLVGSPKQAIKAAFAMGLIQEEDLWLTMIADRNLTVHTYHEALSLEIYHRIKDRYASEFKRCLDDLTTNR